MSKRHQVLQKLSRNMLGFGRFCFPGMFPKASPQFHTELVRLFMDPTIKRLNVIAPRGHAKSTIIAGLCVAWHIFLEDIFHARKKRKGRNKLVVLVSKTQSHSIRLLGTLKQMLQEPRFMQLFGDWTEATAKKWTTTEIVLKDGTTIIAVGTGQMVRGIKQGYQRPTLIILDDPEDENNTKTSEAMEANLAWLLQGLEPAADVDTGKVVVIGTPQHQRCMVYTLQSMTSWESRHYKAIQDDGTSLWPEEWPIGQLMAKKRSYEAIGRVSIFYREYQCQIRLGEDALFREEHFGYWDGHLERVGHKHFLHITHEGLGDDGQLLPLMEPNVVPVNVYMGIDPASSTREGADFTAIVPIAVTRTDHIYVLPYFQGRLSPYDVAHKILDLFKRYRPNSTRIESQGYQEMLRDYLRKGVDVRIPGLEVKELAQGKKLGDNSRIEGLQPLFVEGRVHVKPSMRAFIEEFLFYPKPKHDDLMDGFFYAQKARKRPSHDLSDREELAKDKKKRKRLLDPMLA